MEEQLAAEVKRRKEAKIRRDLFNFSRSTNTVAEDSYEEEAKQLAAEEKPIKFKPSDSDEVALEKYLKDTRRWNDGNKDIRSLVDRSKAKIAGDEPDFDKGPESLDKQHCEEQEKAVKDCFAALESDCLARILLKLPVDSLVRSQLVSKRWCRAIIPIIRCPAFVNEQLPLSEMVLLYRHNPTRLENRNRERPIVDEDIFHVEKSILGYRWEHLKDQLKGEKEVHFNYIDLRDGKAKYLMLASYGVLQGVCDGLVLIINRSSICGPIIVNPVSRESIELVHGTIVPPESESYGFAFNATTGKYIVVHLFKQYEDIGCEIFEVGSSDHWRQVQGPQRGLITDFPKPPVIADDVQFRRPPVVAGGAIHWMPHEGLSRYIVSMSISEKTFHRIQLPETQAEILGEKGFGRYDGLIEKDGLLWFVHHDANKIFSFWVLDKDLGKSQWTLEKTLDFPVDLFPRSPLNIVAVGYNSSSSEFILASKMYDQLYMWDLEKDKMKFYDGGSPSVGWYVPHYNSLVSEKLQTCDHRLLGARQELFFCHAYSRGSWFFLPYGARIFNKLVDFIRVQYRERGYQEVVTPNMYNTQLWETSGRAEDYKENMLVFEIEKQKFGLKQMNCPGHCLMFDHRVRSYRELPLRLADFGVLHRNEASEALTGLKHTRRFQQDDAHIFCRESQIKDEVKNVLEFVRHAYDIFGFTFELELSTRPEKYLGEKETWDKAEVALTRALNEFGRPWKRNEGDGAVYGPKIDINVFDALKRKFRCATLQLDFQLPSRFNLSYSVEDDTKREKPVMIHMAVLGSIEHMIAVLLEQHNGKWPFWLSPRQVIVCSVSKESTEYALELQGQIRAAGYYVDVDITDTKIGNKVQEARLAEYNYMLVVGEADARKGTVSLRARRGIGQHVVMSVEGLLTFFKEEAAAFY